MATATAEEFGFSRRQIETFAAGLYQLAACDGIDDREMTIIHEFLDETGAPEVAATLPDLPFDPADAYRILESSWLRTVFLKAALLLIRADGDVSDLEREQLEWMAMAFGVPGGFDAIVEQLEGQSL